MAIINSRTPMVTPTSTILPPEESDGGTAVVDKKWIRAYCWSNNIRQHVKYVQLT